MPFDQFNTQVLLLHSDQTTLDKFSAGFGDRYTVHCATSGSEALSTLSDTPINVIVSAQKLQGMSGAEALREANRRSPDTVGILLAGEDTAIVGDKEVFQVVHGAVDPSELRRLIDSATQQTRLMALAESANDTSALPDEPASEHIIMETSENGATIISDGTGQMPALDPKKVPPSAAVGAATVDVLVITKDEEFLNTIRESSQGMHNVHYSNTLKQAEDAVRKHKVGVAVVDAAMVGDKVEKLTQHLRKMQKRLVAIVAGRRDDGEMLMDLINRGKVYRFLLKPVSPGRARLAVEASVKHHLEAPDSAFKLTGAPAPAKAAAVKPAPAAKPKPQPAPAARPKPAKSAKPGKAAKPVSKSSPAIKVKREDALAPVDDNLSDAFGDDSKFTETMTGIVSTVTKSIGNIKKPKEARAPEPVEEPSPLSASGGEFPFSPGPKIIGAVAAGVVAVALVGFWVFGGSDDAENPLQQSATPPDSLDAAAPDFSGTEAPVIEETAQAIEDLLEEARLARDAGQIFNPPGNNAIELYLAAMLVAPDNAYAAAELDATLDEALALAETALLERRGDDASAALTRVALANPEHPRLPFLSAQVTQIQLRDYLDTARVAVREGRFEDATMAIESAWTLGLPDTTEIELVEDELRSARSDQRVGEVLALANLRLEEGALTSPANDNARYYYQLALSNDSENAAALTGLTVVASKIVLQAREEIDGGRFSTAEALLAEARQLDPGSEELSATSAALDEARQQDQADRDAEADRVAAEQRAEEERQAAAAREAEAQRVAEQERIAELERQIEERDAAAAAAAATVAAAAATTPETPADTVDPGAAESAAEQPPPATVAEPGPAVPVRDQSPVAASTLTRTKYVAPKYPRSAERRSISGWVDVVFTVTFDGSVRDVVVTGADPAETFDEAATRAVEKWRFEPVVENGDVVEKRAGVRMMFAIE